MPWRVEKVSETLFKRESNNGPGRSPSIIAMITTITGVLYLQDGLIELLYIILLTFSFFLVDGKEVGGIFLSGSTAHKVGEKKPSQVVK